MNQLIHSGGKATMSSREIVDDLLERSDGLMTWEIVARTVGKMNELVAAFCELKSRGLPAADPTSLISATRLVASNTTDQLMARVINDACTVSTAAVVGSFVCSSTGRQRPRSANAKTYFIACRETRGIKIGSSVRPERRLKSLKTGSAAELVLLAEIDANIELELHRIFESSRIAGEWFCEQAVVCWLRGELESQTIDQRISFTDDGLKWIAGEWAKYQLGKSDKPQ